MSPPNEPMISVFGSLVGDEELAEVRDCIENQWLGAGPKGRAFEELFSERLGLPGLVLVNSGSNALQMAVRLLDLEPGDEVIVPSFTWIACAHAVALCGAVPIFCDVDLDTCNVTAETIDAARSARTKAAMVVHYAGKPCDMEPILSLGLPVIEDAAHAVVSTQDGRPCGGISELGIYSFDAIKNLAMGEGGGLTARDPARIERGRLLRYCGIGKSGFDASASKSRWWEYDVTEYFPKMLPPDVTSAIGLAQLRKLDSLQARRREVWDRYQREFADVPGLFRPLEAAANETHSYFTYAIRITGGARDAMAHALKDKGIYTTLRYHPLHLNPIYDSEARLPICEQLNEESLCLPLHPRLTDHDVERVVDAVRSFRR